MTAASYRCMEVMGCLPLSVATLDPRSYVWAAAGKEASKPVRGTVAGARAVGAEVYGAGRFKGGSGGLRAGRARRGLDRVSHAAGVPAARLSGAITMTTTYLDLVTEKATGRVTDEVRREIGGLVSEGGLISEPAQLRTYECDGLTGFRVVPALVVLPASTEEVAAVVRVCARERVPFVARGAGTGLSGGALPRRRRRCVIGLARMREILAVDAEDQRAVVEPGVTNLGIIRRRGPPRATTSRPTRRASSLHDRRQRRGELRRRALPEVRLHHQPRPRRSRSCAPTAAWSPWAATRRTRPGRPARRGRRLGGHARHRHLGHRAAAAHARGGPHAGRRLPRRGAGGQRGQRHRRRPASCRPPSR